MIVLVLPDYNTEDRLLASARDGDSSAVIQIYDEYYQPIFQYIRLRVADPALAEDLASEVFVRLVRAFQAGSAPRETLRGWLFQVARNLIHDHLGRQRQLPQTTLEEWMPADDDGPEQQVMRTLSTERMRRAMRLLAADQQEVVILRFGQMLSLQETADIMGKSVSAIKALQFRAVQTLRSLLDAATP